MLARTRRIVVCEPELLIAQAVAASLSSGQGIDFVEVVTSADALVSELNSRFDAALVSDAVGDELIELFQALAFRRHSLPVVVLATHPDHRSTARLLELGAVGSISWSSSSRELRRAVIDACHNGVVAPGGRTDLLLEAVDERRAERAAAVAVLAALSARERRVLGDLAEGRHVSDIASSLGLSPHTIRASIRRIGAALDVRGQLRIAAGGRDLLAVAQPPSPRFAKLHARLTRMNARPET